MSNFLLEAGRQTLMLELQEASRLPERLGDDFIRAAETIIHCEGKLVVSGIGKSGHIGKKLAATFASTGTPAFFCSPGGSAARRPRNARQPRRDAVYLLLRQRQRAGFLSFRAWKKNPFRCWR
ncbi:glucitol operon GutQ protein [Klebsiella oxytoca]|nr:glucitol operon GutQ protein [Klebsiella oxytoca]